MKKSGLNNFFKINNFSGYVAWLIKQILHKAEVYNDIDYSEKIIYICIFFKMKETKDVTKKVCAMNVH